MATEILEPAPAIDDFDLDLRVGYIEITDRPGVQIFASGSCTCSHARTCTCYSPCSCETCGSCSCACDDDDDGW